MRKQVGSALRQHVNEDWIDIDETATVEVSSEDPAFPVEAALIPGASQGWRAAQPGTQSIRLIFDEPQRLKRVEVAFDEHKTPRTQEFVLRWSPDRSGSFREIVRQQWNFSPPHTTREVETYNLDLPNVAVLELVITPDKSGGNSHASLASLRVA